MKTLEELALTQYDIQAVLPKIILEDVETYARPQRILRQTVRINEDLVHNKGRAITIVRRGQMSCGPVTEANSISDAYGKELIVSDVAGSAYETVVTITPTKFGAWFRISQEAIDGSEFETIRQYIEETAEAIADREDLEIAKTLFGRASLSEKVAKSAASKVYQASSYPLLSLTKVADSAAATTAKTVLAVDYKDGRIKVKESCSGTKVILRYKYSTRTDTLFLDASTAGKLAYPDVADARTKVVVAKYKPDVMVIHPDELGDLLKEDKFLNAASYGSNAPILNGEIGQIGGLRVLSSLNILPGTAIFIDSDKAALQAIKRNLDMKRKEAPEKDAVELYFYAEYASAVLNETALSFVTDCQSNANKGL